MPITVVGPNWKTTRALRAALAEVPEDGQFSFGSGSNKYSQLSRMKNEGVRTVPFSMDRRTVESLIGRGETWLGRKMRHSRGKDIVFMGGRRWRQSEFFTKYIPAKEEWRIHIFQGKSIARGKKIFIPTEDQQTEPTIAIRSRQRNYRLDHTIEPSKDVRAFAKRMIRAAGDTYGACDILVGAEDNDCYALEINTAPAMDDYTLVAYVKAIRQYYGGITQVRAPQATFTMPDGPLIPYPTEEEEQRQQAYHQHQQRLRELWGD